MELMIEVYGLSFLNYKEKILILLVLIFLYKKGKYSFDLDKSMTLSWQGTDKNMKNKRIEYKKSSFMTLGLIPHFRVNKISKNFPLGVG